MLERVAGKFKAHLEAKKNPFMAAVKFNRRRKQQGESFDRLVTDFKLFARGLDITETDKLIRNAIACKSLDDHMRQRCLEKSKNLTLNTAIDIGCMFESTKDGIQVMAGEDPRVEVNALVDKKGQPGKRRKPKQLNRGDGSPKSANGVGTTATDPKKRVTRKIIPVDGVTRWGILQVSAEVQQEESIQLIKIIVGTTKKTKAKICIYYSCHISR